MVLFSRALREDLKSLIGWTLLVAVTVLGYMGFYKVMVTSGSLKDIAQVIDNLPPVLKGLLGMSANVNTLNGFVQALVFNGIPPLYFTIFVSLGTLSIVTKEIDARTMEYILTNPVSRYQVMTNRATVLLLEVLVLEVVLGLSAWVGGKIVGGQPDLAFFASVCLSGWLLYYCVAGLFALFCTFIDDYQKGLFLILGIGFILFFAGIVLETQSGPGAATAKESFSVLKALNPYTYHNTADMFKHGTLIVRDAVTLLVAGTALWGLAVLSFNRKQIA